MFKLFHLDGINSEVTFKHASPVYTFYILVEVHIFYLLWTA